MAYMKTPKTPAEIKKATAPTLRKEYAALADQYKKILNDELIKCPHCGEWLARSNFYKSSKYGLGYYPICKKCVISKVEQIKDKDDKPNETKESVINMCREMDIPYVDSLYESCAHTIYNETGEKVKSSPFKQMLTSLLSLPQYINQTFKDSELPSDYENNGMRGNVKKQTIKRFGSGFTNDDYLFLQDEYDDWVTRYECSTKAQEELFIRLCFKKLEIRRATIQGKPTKDLDESYQKLMSTANITPRQNSLDTLSEGQSVGQLIQKWEVERPIPECDPELKDVDHIGQYIDVFYKGHMAKMLNLKNSLQNIYESFMRKFTVTRPEYQEDDDSEELFDKIFGEVSDNG